MLDFQKIEREYNYYKSIEQEINLISDLVRKNQKLFNAKIGNSCIQTARFKLEKLISLDNEIKDAATGKDIIITPSLEEMKSKRESIFRSMLKGMKDTLDKVREENKKLKEEKQNLQISFENSQRRYNFVSECFLEEKTKLTNKLKTAKELLDRYKEIDPEITAFLNF